MADKGKSSLVLVLYTGGTIGMKKLNDNGKIPGFLSLIAVSNIRYHVQIPHFQTPRRELKK